MIILASASPRRTELLNNAGIAHQVIPANIVEQTHPEELPTQTVQRLAQEKATCIAKQYPTALVIGADTLIAIEQTTIGKPKNLAEAKQILRQLSNCTHQVITGVSIQRQTPPHNYTWFCTTQVTFKKLTTQTIDKYCNLVNTLDKAGAYAIQEYSDLIIDHTKGLISNVIGLPYQEVAQYLQKISHSSL